MIWWDLASDVTEAQPSAAATVQVDRVLTREASALSLEVRIWKARLRVDYRVQGPLSWAAPLCAVVLLDAIGAALFVPRLVLPATASLTAQTTVAAAAGGTVLLAGMGFLLYWLRRRSPTVSLTEGSSS